MKYLEHSDLDEIIEVETKDCSTYSSGIDDNKNRCGHYPLVMESVCLVNRDVDDIFSRHIWVDIVPKGELEGEVGDAHKAAHDGVISHELCKMRNFLSLSEIILISINHVRPKLPALKRFGGPSEATGTRNALIQPLAAKIGPLVSRSNEIEILQRRSDKNEAVAKNLCSLGMSGTASFISI
ncbi:hypothetical protein FXO38_31733 [Capsicum annuum]|uniref:RecA-like N-terminal domain-containing protein n=1 Tax=Capsicum annuum TaxID=4072 RepID=A0A2G2Y6U7_CAPAN|nr:hypothetical protein FXO38_31733 [Capsicum annuum]KAF3638363.1 hypothetical protein FXO37_24448 [Capsicum annuum]PHT65487.1 hypothetical protein T459_29912 [Capsicum annuum]